MDLERVRDLVAQGRYVTALREASAAADQDGAADRAQYLLVAATAADRLGLRQEQERLASLVLAGADADPDCQARALLALGAVELDRGDPYRAEEHLLRAAALPIAPPVMANVQYHLGCTYEAMRRPETAMAAFRRAAEMTATCGWVRREIQARHNLAWLLLDQGAVAAALPELRRTAQLLEAESPLQAQQLALEASTARLSGQGAEAVRICEDLLAPTYPGANAWCRCYAAWLAGDVAADEGRTDLGRQFLERARRDAEAARDPALWNRLTALQRRVDEM